MPSERATRLTPDGLLASAALLASSHDGRFTPSPLIVEGDETEWLRSVDDAESALMTLGSSPFLTIGVVRGTVRAPFAALVAACDLRAGHAASGGVDLTYEGDAIDDTLGDWCDAFVRSPRSATIAALLLRRPHDLLSEDLAYSALQSGPEFSGWLRTRGERRSSATMPRSHVDWDLNVVHEGPRVTVLASVGYHEVVLRRPQRHNALDSTMRSELCDVLDALPEDGIVGLRGIGPSFCAGGDLDEFGLLDDPVGAFFSRHVWSVAERLRRRRVRLIAGIHGACVGAGIELAAFATRVIAGESTRIRLPEVGFGLLPGSGGTVSIPPRIGAHRLLDLLLTGRWIDAEQALRIGMVDEVVPDDVLVRRLREQAARLAA